MAAIFELDEHLKQEFKIFEAAPQVSVSVFMNLINANTVQYTVPMSVIGLFA